MTSAMLALEALRIPYALERECSRRDCESCYWNVEGTGETWQVCPANVRGIPVPCPRWRSCRDALARLERERMGRP